MLLFFSILSSGFRVQLCDITHGFSSLHMSASHVYRQSLLARVPAFFSGLPLWRLRSSRVCATSLSLLPSVFHDHYHGSIARCCLFELAFVSRVVSFVLMRDLPQDIMLFSTHVFSSFLSLSLLLFMRFLHFSVLPTTHRICYLFFLLCCIISSSYVGSFYPIFIHGHKWIQHTRMPIYS